MSGLLVVLLVHLTLLYSTAEATTFSSQVTTNVNNNVEYTGFAVSTAIPAGDLYWVSSCDNSIPVSFSTCNNIGADGSTLYPYCIGVQEVTPVNSSSAQTINYAGNVSNWLTCTGSLVVSLATRYGIASVSFTAGDYTHIVYSATSSPADGVTPVSVCCQDIRQGLNQSNGLFSVAVTTFGETDADILIPVNFTQLPLPDYLPLVPIEVSCGGTVYTCENGGCPTHTASTQDPIYSFWTTTLKNQIGDITLLELEEEPNTWTSILWITKSIPGSVVNSHLFGFGEDIVDDTSSGFNSSCTVSYGNVVDSQGTAVDVVSDSSIELFSEDCKYTSYISYYTAFQYTVNFLQSAAESSLSSSQTFSIIDLASTVANSIVWNSCLDKAYSFLDTNTEPFSENTTDCQLADSDPEWELDPCCNTMLQLEQCCRSAPYSYERTEHVLPENFDATNDFETCNFPNCLVQPIKNLQSISGFTSQDDCSVARTAAENDPAFSLNPFEECLARATGVKCFYDNVCKTIDATSVCDPITQRCVIPCDAQTPCYNGNCSATGRCENLSNATTVIYGAVYQCVLDNIDPYIAVILQNEIEVSSNNGTTIDKFQALIQEESCSTPSGIAIGDGYTRKQCDAYPGYCKINANLLGPNSLVAGQANTPTGKVDNSEEFCDKASLYAQERGGYCSFVVSDFVSVPIGRPNACQLRTNDTMIPFIDYSEAGCLGFGGDTWVSTDGIGWRDYGACLVFSNNANVSSDFCTGNYSGYCLGPQWKGEPCASYCADLTVSQLYNPSADSSFCVGANQTWMISQSGYGMCVYTEDAPESAQGFISCNATKNGPYTGFLTGRDWLPAEFNTPESCPQEMCFGYVDGTGFKPSVSIEDCVQYKCSSCVFGNEPSCAATTAEECAAYLSCDNQAGCILPTFLSALVGIDIPCQWTPEYCVTVYDFNSCAINPYSGGWLYPSAFPTQTYCENAIQICNDGSVPDGSYINHESLPDGYNYRNQSECEACGGHIENWYKWRPSNWTSNNIIIGPTWSTDIVAHAVWQYNPSANRMADLLDRARVRRLTSILSAELNCLYGIESDLLIYVACACNADDATAIDACYETLTSLSGNPVSVIGICEGVDVQANAYGANINATDFRIINAAANQLPCITVELSIVPLEQFTFKASGLTSSLALVTETEEAQLSATSVYNQNDVAVGSLVGDGYGFTITPSADFQGVTLCITLPSSDNLTWSFREPPAYFDIGVSNISDFTFVPLGLNLPLNSTEICTTVQSMDLVYFPIALFDEWETATLSQTWTSEEKGLMVFCIVMFLILLIWVTISLICRVLFDGVNKFPRPEMCLMSLIILSSLGAAYLIGTFVGAYQGSHLNPLFTDLPQLCLLSCVTITCSTWYTVIKRGSMERKKETTGEKMAPFVFLASLYIIFIGLQIASQTTDNTKEFTCATTEDQKNAMTTSESVSTSWKAIFAFYTFIIACLFGAAGVTIVHMVKDLKDFKDILYKSVTVTVVATVALFITVAISLYSVVHTVPNTTKLAFIIAVLVLPGYALAYLFSYRSSFTAKLARGKISTSTMRSRLSRTASKGSVRNSVKMSKVGSSDDSRK